MIAFLEGTIRSKGPGYVVLQTGGVGYEVKVLPSVALEMAVQDTCSLFTFQYIRETSVELFGFRTEDQLRFFNTLLTISGVGPKMAQHILSLGTVEEIQSAIAREDISYLTKVSGIGRKTAERIVVELKDKMQNTAGAVERQLGAHLTEIMDALVAMGYSSKEAREAALSVKDESGESTELLKKALQYFKKYV